MDNAAMNTPTDLKEKKSWIDLLAEEKSKPYFKEVLDFVENERRLGKTIYPKNSDVFNAFALTQFEEVKVVIIGQDPYYGPNQAHGLCFSVLPPTPPPPSLINIFKEISSDLGTQYGQQTNGSLERWAKQGVLLLNSVLTVESGKPGSHAQKGWERFTDHVITILDREANDLVFLLWGAYAQKKAQFVNRDKHLVLSSVHPSPLSVYRGFLGCKHFTKANAFLTLRGRPTIEWQSVIN